MICLRAFSPLFAYLNKLEQSPFDNASFVSVMKNKVVFASIYLKISTFLFADTYLLQSQANCMALMSMTSAKSPDNEQIKQTLTCAFDSLKLLHESTVLIFVLHGFSFFWFQNLFLTNVQGILCHVYKVSKPISYQCSRHSMSCL